MSKYLPTQYQQVFYVYFHVDPATDEVVYVGSGTKERAWTIRESNRSNEQHLDWLLKLETEGRTPDEHVHIAHKFRTKREALDKEAELIEELNPRFNRTLDRSWALVLSVAQVEDAKSLRDMGFSYKKIADKIGTSTMTVYRLLNGETKGYV